MSSFPCCHLALCLASSADWWVSAWQGFWQYRPWPGIAAGGVYNVLQSPARLCSLTGRSVRPWLPPVPAAGLPTSPGKVKLELTFLPHLPPPHLLLRVWRLVEAYWREVIRLPESEDKCQLQSRLGQAQGWPEDPADTASDQPQPFYVTPIAGSGIWKLPQFPDSDPCASPIDINMMPFLAEADFESCRLPEFVRPYWGLIEACLAPEIERSWSNMWPSRSLPSRRGAVCYLTIQESQV